MSNNLQDWIGTELEGGRYQVVDKLGEGGMGTVYRALDKEQALDVVIKTPHRDLLQSDTFTKRFHREMRSLAHLTHPNIVAVTSIGSHHGVPFAVMKHLAGGDLEDQRPVDETGNVLPYDPSQLGSWLPEISQALDFVHQKGYVHRDIKPSNILFDSQGTPHISDFGVVKLTMEVNEESHEESLTGQDHLVGTVTYMAPEILLSNEADSQSDQYSLALTVYELLAGELPFPESKSLAASLEHLTQPIPPLRDTNASVSPELAAALHRALQRDPDQRYPSCGTFSKALLATTVSPETSQAVRAAIGSSPLADEARLTCPACQVQLKITARFAGQSIHCPQCRSTLQIAKDLSRLKIQKTSSDDTQLISKKKTASIPKPKSSKTAIRPSSSADSTPPQPEAKPTTAQTKSSETALTLQGSRAGQAGQNPAD
ncbi:MAG TPA: serine/threonine protein kinase, partial [Planctomycetes bacterium]|nr:serine/threonine protein kinase [Planctomycetota bacterium]